MDAARAESLGDLAHGAAALYNCVNPAHYHRWPELWPPVAGAFLAAAEQAQALLVTTGNLYPYGPVDGAMVEGMPDAGTGDKAVVRARMGGGAPGSPQRAVARCRGPRVRLHGPGGRCRGHVPRVLPQALGGKAVRVLGSPDQPHTWTDVADLARCMVAVADREDAWGRIWHARSNPPRTQREAVHDVCRVMARPPVAVRSIPASALALLGRVVPTIGALRATAYQFDRPAGGSHLAKHARRVAPNGYPQRRSSVDSRP